MRSLLVLILSFFVLGAEAGTANLLRSQAMPDQPTFRSSVTDVQVEVQVLHGRRQVADLRRQDFRILDGGEAQPIVFFGHESVPLDLILLLDVSGSVQKYLRDIAAISRSALRAMGPQDQVAVMVFSRDSWIEQTFTTAQEDIADAIDKASHEQPVGSGTRIYGAIQAAVRYIGDQTSASVRRRAILVVTDNDGMSYAVHREDLIRNLFNTNVVLDAIAVGRHPHPPVPRPGAVINPDFAFDDVFPLAEATGGEALAASKPQDRLAEMLTRLRSSYSLIYHMPANVVPGTYRKIRVELTDEARRRFPGATVAARDGYYVSREEPKKDNEHQSPQ
jgi:VWFA-related protein